MELEKANLKTPIAVGCPSWNCTIFGKKSFTPSATVSTSFVGEILYLAHKFEYKITRNFQMH